MPEQPTRGTSALYLEIPLALRERLDEFVKRTRRTLKGEVSNAIEQYLDREEKMFPPSAETAEPPAKKGKKK
jgi:predicted DNA-binding protein